MKIDKNPPDIRFNKNLRLVPCKCAHRARSVRANAGKHFEHFGRLRKTAVKVARNLLRCAMQIERAAVVPQPRPRRKYRACGSARKRCNCRKFCEKEFVFFFYSISLRLLKHYFRYQNLVGIARFSPRQIMPAVLFVPSKNMTSKLFCP